MLTSAVFLLIIAIAYATVTDLRSRRIPNRLTFPIIAGGLILRTIDGGQDGLMVGLGGAGVALAVMVAPFALNWVGAGDVKLAMAVGALMGPNFVFTTLVFAAVVAGAIAMADIVRQRQLAATAQYLFISWRLPAPQGLALKQRLPYAPAMACGCAVAFMVTALNI